MVVQILLLAGCTNSVNPLASPMTSSTRDDVLVVTPSAIGDLSFGLAESEVLPILENRLGTDMNILSGVDYCQYRRMINYPLPSDNSMTYSWADLTVTFKTDSSDVSSADRFLAGWLIPLAVEHSRVIAPGYLTQVTFEQLATQFPSGRLSTDPPGNPHSFMSFMLSDQVGYWGTTEPENLATSVLVC